MAQIMRAYIGWDGRDALAYAVNRSSLLNNASAQVDIIPLVEWRLRQRGIYHRRYMVEYDGQRTDTKDGLPFSTDFSYTRFLVPLIEGYRDEWVLFADADILWRGDIAELFALADNRYAVMCVQHDHIPSEKIKMGGLVQTRYARKNWSSVMLLNPSKCRRLTRYAVNNEDGSYLHQMLWLDDAEIGALPVEWNWLDGFSDETVNPKVVHYTRGTPDQLSGETLSFDQEYWNYARAADMAAFGI